MKGLCGSLAVDLARHGAKNLVILARSGYEDKLSQNSLRDIHAQDCHVDLIKGDVAIIDDVRRAFKEASMPIGGVIQGAMVLRVKANPHSSLSES